MRRVEELAMVMPLGDAAEYAHTIQRMRPEIRAEIEFRLQELDLPYCGKEELWRLMWLAETRYPMRQARPFVPRFKPRPATNVRAATTTAAPVVLCWICDGPGHRANACPKRQGTGCARCGSKAHNLVACPQRPDGRRSQGGPPPRGGQKKGGKKPTK